MTDVSTDIHLKLVGQYWLFIGANCFGHKTWPSVEGYELQHILQGKR